MKYALVYGGLSGIVIIVIIVSGLTLADRDGLFTSHYFGYLVMLVALSLIFVGVKRYRDVECGGIIRFWPALKMGLGIAVVAGIVYVLVWEVYLASTGYRFMEDMFAAMAESLRAEGASEAAIAAEMAQYQWVRDNYPNPLFRIPITFLEPLPVSLLVALVSAALLRNPRILPARQPA